MDTRIMDTRIKPLVWELGSTGWRAVSIIGTFHVSGGVWTLTAANGMNAGKAMEMRDDDIAKAAAQAHYERLIRLTLEP